MREREAWGVSPAGQLFLCLCCCLSLYFSLNLARQCNNDRTTGVHPRVAFDAYCVLLEATGTPHALSRLVTQPPLPRLNDNNPASPAHTSGDWTCLVWLS
ncbi:hypothetical protein BKA67DRAFT_567889 [Truncatella angustata]|uniref:Uncharacterized protein n=1 Tax=Truncatella angustata TaxID=152316 RepID=A0A9P8UID1_9PEZI|nr:uncharacterized protein BKA67DRAFT_567889 [Truncatella angustata]KAH6652913.1 hypothetical protein BKA67DRAFT_567889 [Truncatella angustata]